MVRKIFDRHLSKTIAIAGAVLFASGSVAEPPGAFQNGAGTSTPMATLTFNIEVIKAQGAVMIALFDSAPAYGGKGQPVRATRVPAEKLEMTTSFEGLKPGTYAVKAYHDLDGDGQLSVNPFGLPIEPFAFSNGAQAHYGPPSFDKAALTIGAGETQDTLRFAK